LKLHDIPNTVERAARVYGRLGVSFFTLHAAGGVSMLEAGVQGLAAGAAEADVDLPIALGVTVLTSEIDTSAFADRLDWAVKAGCQGVVASGLELGRIRAHYPDLGTMIPGVRLPNGDAGDQVRIVTPDHVVAEGGDWIVVGRAVSGAADRAEAAAAVSAAVELVM
jgi:orotidine-5'-phosphate decarboxylase